MECWSLIITCHGLLQDLVNLLLNYLLLKNCLFRSYFSESHRIYCRYSDKNVTDCVVTSLYNVLFWNKMLRKPHSIMLKITVFTLWLYLKSVHFLWVFLKYNSFYIHSFKNMILYVLEESLSYRKLKGCKRSSTL